MAAHLKKMLLGYFLMVLYVIGNSCSSAAVQSLQRAVPDFQLGVFRYIGGALLASFPVIYSGLSIKVPTHLLLPLVSFSASCMVWNLLFFFAVSVLPLSHVSSLSCVFQMIIMAVILVVLYHDRGTLLMYTSVFGCVAGMVLVLQPWMDFNQGFTPGFAETIPIDNKTFSATSSNVSFNVSVLAVETTTQSVNKGLLLLGYTTVVMAGGMEAVAVLILSKYLSEMNSAMIVLYGSAISIIPQALCWLYMEQPVLITDPYTMLLIAIHAFSLALGLIAATHACTLISPMQVSLVFNFGSVINVVLQYTLLSGHLYGRRNLLEVFGCLLISASITLSALSNEKDHEDFNV